MATTKQLIQRVTRLDRKKVITYIILGSVILLLFITIGFTLILRNDSSSSPMVTTKLRAALLTYKRTIVIKVGTPTPVGNGGLPTIRPTVSEVVRVSVSPGPTSVRQPNSTTAPGSNQSTAATSTPGVTSGSGDVSPTDTVIYDGGAATDTPAAESPTVEALGSDTATPIELAADTTTGDTTASPTKTDTLPETGTVQYPIILFISATVFLFISFLF